MRDAPTVFLVERGGGWFLRRSDRSTHEPEGFDHRSRANRAACELADRIGGRFIGWAGDIPADADPGARHFPDVARMVEAAEREIASVWSARLDELDPTSPAALATFNLRRRAAVAHWRREVAAGCRIFVGWDEAPRLAVYDRLMSRADVLGLECGRDGRWWLVLQGRVTPRRGWPIATFDSFAEALATWRGLTSAGEG